VRQQRRLLILHRQMFFGIGIDFLEPMPASVRALGSSPRLGPRSSASRDVDSAGHARPAGEIAGDVCCLTAGRSCMSVPARALSHLLSHLPSRPLARRLPHRPHASRHEPRNSHAHQNAHMPLLRRTFLNRPFSGWGGVSGMDFPLPLMIAARRH